MLDADGLNILVDRVWSAAEKAGLTLPRIHFELVNSETIQMLASHNGMPIRYAHWSFGKHYQRMRTAHDYRLTQIYELVINSEPTYAFLDEQSRPAQALLIIAHVLGHADFFRHNRLFRGTRLDMVNQMAGHRRKITEWRRQHGIDAVETLIDAAQVLTDFTGTSASCRADIPPDDVLGYVIEHSPNLLDWERECLMLLHREARYFWPQLLTKVANEGYATFWHTHLLREALLSPEEIWEAARLNAGILEVHPPQLNPYRLGFLLFRRAYQTGGLKAVFQCRDLYDDAGLVRALVDDDLMVQSGLALFHERDQEPEPRAASFDKIRERLLCDLDRAGLPHVIVEHALSRSGTLVLRHLHDGRDLDFSELPQALKMVAQRLWGGPVELTTVRQRVIRQVCHDGNNWVDNAG